MSPQSERGNIDIGLQFFGGDWSNSVNREIVIAKIYGVKYNTP